jgi:hypothetical protein
MKDSFTFSVDTDGTLHCIYDDCLADLFKEGQTTITRASHVEPTADGQWTADMSPSGGPVLGPFPLRQTALDAEVAWLEEKLFGKESHESTERQAEPPQR